jgi:hypothetical protein
LGFPEISWIQKGIHMLATFAGVTALALIVGPALAQTAPTRPSSSPTIPTLPTAPTRPISPCYPTRFEPCSSWNMPVGLSVNSALAPQVYVHSFTADEARSRMEAGGYVGITDLQQDVHGNWHGKAIKDGRTVQVTLDFNSNVKK